MPATQVMILVACSKRSDSGERCEVKKGMKSRGGLGRVILGAVKTINPLVHAFGYPGFQKIFFFLTDIKL